MVFTLPLIMLFSRSGGWESASGALAREIQDRAGLAPVEREWKGELFASSAQNLLQGCQAGDTVVFGGRCDGGAAPRLVVFGHQGTLSVPLDGAYAPAGSLLRARFRVTAGHKGLGLKLLASLAQMDTAALQEQAARDFRQLLPRLRSLPGKDALRLLNESIEGKDFRVVPPPEGWQVLYVVLQRASNGEEAHLALRYELSGGHYQITRCWAEQRRGERPYVGV